MPETFVLVGASLAGGAAAASLREEGFEGRVVLVGAESHLPYERPPLSKDYLRGEQPFEEALFRPAAFYQENDVETLLGVRAERVAHDERVVELADGERLRYDKLLLATGGRNRRTSVPGRDLDGVYDLRSVEDADRIRAAAAPGRRAVVIGMGFIGSEVAASLRQLGVDVVAVAAQSVPLERVLGSEVGGVLAAIHSDQGVELIGGDRMAVLEGDGRVERVQLASGRRVDCDFVVVGVGIEPSADLAEAADIEVDDGIVVDEHCRTSVEGIFAAGDVAMHYHPLFGRRLRVEHWQNALNHGAAAARSMLGKGEPYDDVHWFWSDQYDANLQYTGFHSEWDELVIRGSLEERSFVGFYLKDGRVLASVALNRGRDLRRSVPLIKAALPVDSAKLRDPEVDLRTLAGDGGS